MPLLNEQRALNSICKAFIARGLDPTQAGIFMQKHATELDLQPNGDVTLKGKTLSDAGMMWGVFDDGYKKLPPIKLTEQEFTDRMTKGELNTDELVRVEIQLPDKWEVPAGNKRIAEG